VSEMGAFSIDYCVGGDLGGLGDRLVYVKSCEGFV